MQKQVAICRGTRQCYTEGDKTGEVPEEDGAIIGSIMYTEAWLEDVYGGRKSYPL